MFVLRKITGEGFEMNFALGDSYNLIEREKTPKEFFKVGADVFGDIIPGYVYGFVTCDKTTHVLSTKQKSFIMTEGGKTFTQLKP